MSAELRLMFSIKQAYYNNGLLLLENKIIAFLQIFFMPSQYSFETKWQLKAPVEEVWNAVYNSLEWQQWWKGVFIRY